MAEEKKQRKPKEPPTFEPTVKEWKMSSLLDDYIAIQKAIAEVLSEFPSIFDLSLETHEYKQKASAKVDQLNALAEIERKIRERLDQEYADRQPSKNGVMDRPKAVERWLDGRIKSQSERP